MSKDSEESPPESEEESPAKNIVIVGGKLYWRQSGILITRRDIRRARHQKRKQK